MSSVQKFQIVRFGIHCPHRLLETSLISIWRKIRLSNIKTCPSKRVSISKSLDLTNKHITVPQIVAMYQICKWCQKQKMVANIVEDSIHHIQLGSFFFSFKFLYIYIMAMSISGSPRYIQSQHILGNYWGGGSHEHFMRFKLVTYISWGAYCSSTCHLVITSWDTIGCSCQENT